jgi:hypothetical protein
VSESVQIRWGRPSDIAGLSTTKFIISLEAIMRISQWVEVPDNGKNNLYALSCQVKFNNREEPQPPQYLESAKTGLFAI